MDSFLPQQDPNNPFPTPPISGQELLMRTLATAAAPQQLPRARTLWGRGLNFGTGMVGGYAGTVADELARQRYDPVRRELQVAQAVLDKNPARPVGTEGPLMEQGGFLSSQPAQPTAQQLVLGRMFPQMQPGAQADVALKQAQLGVVIPSEITAREQAAKTSAAQAAESTQRTAVSQQQQASDMAFRTQFGEYRKNNPKATSMDLARQAGIIAAETGASKELTGALLEGVKTEDAAAYHAGLMEYYKGMIGNARSTDARLRDEFKQSLDAKDVSEARQIGMARRQAIQGELAAHSAENTADARIVSSAITGQEPHVKEAQTRMRARRQEIDDARKRLNDLERDLQNIGRGRTGDVPGGDPLGILGGGARSPLQPPVSGQY